MLRKERLKEYIGRRCERIRNCLQVYCLGRNPEALHVLRVEVKKLKAVVCLLRACGGRHFRTEGLDPIKPVYEHAALIRTAQVNLELLEAHGLRHESFRQRQLAVLAEEAERFCLEHAAYQRRVRKVQRALTAHVPDIGKSCILCLFQDLLGELHGFFRQHFPAGGLHQSRKTLKTLLYLHALLPDALAAALQLEIPYLDRLQQLVGRWHDAEQAAIVLAGAFTGESLLPRLQEQGAVLLGEVRVLSQDFRKKAAGEQDGSNRQ